jgi:hypothetical protein
MLVLIVLVLENILTKMAVPIGFSPILTPERGVVLELDDGTKWYQM